MKPALTWTIALGGLLLLAGAMAWATHSLMGMERNQQRMEAEAAVQEGSRLALWRMESIAAALVVEESARPPDQYRTSPDKAPLLSPESRIRLHFELDADGRVRSPQAAAGPDKPVVPDEPALRLQELRTRLAEKAGPDQWAQLGQNMPVRAMIDNRAWLSAANSVLPGLEENEGVGEEKAKEQVISKDKASSRYKALDDPAPAPAAAPAAYNAPPLPSTLKPSEARQQQEDSNKKEADMRQRAVGDLAKSATAQRLNNESLPKSKKADPVPPPAPAAAPERMDQDQTALRAALPVDAVSRSVGGAPAVDDPAAPAAAAPAGAAQAAETMSAAAKPSATGRIEAAKAAMGPAPVPDVDPPPSAAISDFRALWIKDALLLTRRVTQDGASVIQGAWVDWPRLRTDLLESVSDLFPAAALEAAPSDTWGGTDLLASLPIRFRPGLRDSPLPPFWSPLKLSLATAWGCVLLASAAVAMVLRGMMLLSERRAAFVSAVTHELRTPLATFKLYSEMLADGLVKDPEKRQAYLETLTTEADRLGHLVENVLSYSRLERGKASEGRIRTALGDLLHRVEPRLHQRVSTAGAEFSVHHENVPDAFELVTDPAAVEQILFNLVDNACKYGGRDGAPAQLELVVGPAPGSLRLAVRDHGRGLTKTEARKLFRPFHKSAREAAHTAPGVGLGLALCRRLACDLGGTLEIDHAWPHGACFVLTLPVAGIR